MYPKLLIARKERKLTQSQVAEKIGMHKQSYYKKENKVVEFTITEALLLSKFFDKSLDELFGE